MKSLKTFIKTYEWWLLSGAMVTTFILSMVGYAIAFEGVTEDVTLADLAYYAFQIFTLKFTHPKGHVPLLLDIARFLAPILTGLAGLNALLLITREQVRMLKAKTYKGHVVICGLNAKSVCLAEGLLISGEKVLAVDPDDHNAYRQQLFVNGGVLLRGEPNDKHILRLARVHRAKYLICFTEDDSVNTASAFLAYNLVKQEGTQSRFTSYVHVSDLQTLRRMEDLDAFIDKERRGSNASSMRENEIFTFNTYERAARQLLQKYPPDAAAATRSLNDPPVHIVVFGFGLLGQGLLLQCAQMGHYLNRKKTVVTVVAHANDEKAWTKFVAQHQLQNAIEPLFAILSEIDLDQQTLDTVEIRVPVSSVFVALDDDNEAFRCAHVLHRLRSRQKKQVIVALNNPEGILNLLPDTIGCCNDPLFRFDIIAETCTGEAIVNESLDKLARIIHEDYLATQRKQGRLDPTKQSHQTWSLLRDEIKNHNRSQADHIWVKLRAIGCLTQAVGGPLEVFDFAAHPNVVEQLSVLEHSRWCAYMFINGWTSGAQRNDIAKVHNDLVAYDRLSEHVKQYDRDTVMNIPKLLKQLGLEVVANPKATLNNTERNQ